MPEFTDREEELIRRLSKTDLKEREAKVLVAVAREKEAEDKDIEDLVDISPSPISIALNDMIERGWISRGKEKTEGRGHPFYVYSLKVPLSDIIEELMEKEKEKIRDIEKRIEDLEELVKYISG